MAETKKKGLGLPQTKGTFQVRGKVVGTDKDKFYIEKMTKNNKPWRSINFGVQFDSEKTLYVGTNGMERDNVYFCKKIEDGKTDKKVIPWKDRFNYHEEGYRMIGVNVGVEKTTDENGNTVNNKKTLTDYDSCKEISDHLRDDMSVFVKGNLEFSTYQDSHRTKFVTSQVSLTKDDVDFEKEEFHPVADFTQMIVFMGVTPNKEKTRATVEAKIVTYDTIEDAEFIIEDMNLARMFAKQLKPYTGIKVWGRISVEKDTEEVETTDCWGKKNNMDKVNSPTIRELIIEGADPNSIDTGTFTESEIDKAIEEMKAAKAAENDFGGSENGGWGTVQHGSEDGMDDETGW
ncbi:hypothetical protein F170042I7_19950 [Blautia caecimuris]|uniref:hypothetical protein n=1 Tax=Blautia caecimuris TaxID=1796615 RepID=UPI0034BD1901